MEPENLKVLPSYKIVKNGCIASATTKSLVTVDQLTKLQVVSNNYAYLIPATYA